MRTHGRHTRTTVPAAALAAVLALAAGACGQSGPGPAASVPGGDTVSVTEPTPAPAAPLVGTRWTVTALVDAAGATDVPAEAAARAHFTIDADGSVRGSLGCNRFTGRVTTDAGTVTFGPVSATRMACGGPTGEVERALSTLLAAGPLTYAVTGQTMTLTTPAGTGVTAQGTVAVE
ncbi:META domain-containing protein [Streptomyces sp. NPDC090022]|uniref:META domain-containing protein n=1 Tax=Streptomyces sp. NPDC090022 TaxID=3365920 RepID=UPI0038221A04